MQRTHFSHIACPVAQSLERVGEWWSILIVRDAFRGLTKFDEFRQSLGVSPSMLTRRLNTLVRNDVLYKRPYQARPARYEYVLTERGEALFPVLLSLLNWGNSFLGETTADIVPVHRRTGGAVTPLLVDRLTGEPLNYQNVKITQAGGHGEGPRPDAGPASHPNATKTITIRQDRQ